MCTDLRGGLCSPAHPCMGTLKWLQRPGPTQVPVTRAGDKEELAQLDELGRAMALSSLASTSSADADLCVALPNLASSSSADSVRSFPALQLR